MNETQLENLCLDWFAENGWEVVHGIDIALIAVTLYAKTINRFYWKLTFRPPLNA
jgi:hypothetical protein